MKEVSKDKFFASFDTKSNVTTGCPFSHKVWEVRQNGILIAKSEQAENGVKKYLIAA